MAHQLAVESPQVTADVIEVVEFPDVARRYHVQRVPKTIINEQVSVDGAVPESPTAGAGPRHGRTRT